MAKTSRIIEDNEKSYPSAKLQEGAFDNRVIFGENLLALKALEAEFTGKVKCIYIDPPYNTRQKFTHYKDSMKSAEWLQFMVRRIEILHRLLSEDGTLWISLDDAECAYLKIECDKIFGRKNFIANVVWQKSYSPKNDAKHFSTSHENILLFAKNKEVWRPNLLPRTGEMDARYRNHDGDPRGRWMPDNLSVKTYAASTDYPIITPTGRIVLPPKSRSWRFSKERFEEFKADNRIWFGANSNNVPTIKRFLHEVQQGKVAESMWWHIEVGSSTEGKKEIKKLFTSDIFDTPKPERLIHRILHLSTQPGDLVLDCFAGSGTTGSVAHKMRRRYILVEVGQHCHTHIIPRLRKVVDGEDQGGITKAVGWEGGGGFRYFRTADKIF